MALFFPSKTLRAFLLQVGSTMNLQTEMPSSQAVFHHVSHPDFPSLHRGSQGSYNTHLSQVKCNIDHDVMVEMRSIWGKKNTWGNDSWLISQVFIWLFFLYAIHSDKNHDGTSWGSSPNWSNACCLGCFTREVTKCTKDWVSESPQYSIDLDSRYVFTYVHTYTSICR